MSLTPITVGLKISNLKTKVSSKILQLDQGWALISPAPDNRRAKGWVSIKDIRDNYRIAGEKSSLSDASFDI